MEDVAFFESKKSKGREVKSENTATGRPPQVSVVMSVYNGAAFLDEAVMSLRDQTLRDIEIILVDDASNDETPAILASHAADDLRVRVLTLETNHRIPAAVNRGLDIAQAPYIARMDADDVALPERLAVQKRVLDHNPGITLCATSIQWIDGEGRPGRTSRRSRDTFAVRWLARFLLTLSQPTYMFRREAPGGAPLRYDPEQFLAEDHELVCRLLAEGGEMICLPDVLLRYRRHGEATSLAKMRDLRISSREVCERFQADELPPEIYEALAPLREAYFDDAPAGPRAAAIFAGLEAMIAHDVAAHPDRRVWMRRQAAQLAAWALQRGGADKQTIARAFLSHGRRFMLPAAIRALETKGMLPRVLASDPQVPAPR